MIGIWLNGKKWKLNVEFGWWKGEPFALFDIAIFEAWEDVVDLLRLKFAKMHFSISLLKITG